MVKLRSNPRVLTGALLASLGIVPQACGGQSASTGDDDAAGNGGSGATGGNATGGSGGTGDNATGGSGATGGNTTGGNATGGDSATGGSGGSLPENRYPCENPVEVFPGSGFFRCESGAWHRRSVETCAVSIPRPDPLPDLPDATCNSDLDCQDMPYGYCQTSNLEGLATRFCHQGCATDADCDSSQICECGEFVGRCISSTCVSDADCEAGFLCQTHDDLPGCSGRAYACQLPADSCASDADCNAASRCSAGYQGLEARSCIPMSCVPGRPFLVDGAVRVAESASRSDWLEASELSGTSALSPELREAAGRFYAECAALEHASVAAFSRFTLGLLAVGAPAELVAESVRSTRDEVEHARAAYGLASHFLGRSIGPGALAIDGALGETLTLEGLALATFLEGCIGETLGALEAREAALHAIDATLRRILECIADDEARHAALAFRFVAWALERAGPALRARLVDALARARNTPSLSENEPGAGLEPLGVLSHEHRARVRRLGFAEVIEPCVEALFARTDRSEAGVLFAPSAPTPAA